LHGDVSVSIKKNNPISDGSISISVSDTGIGIKKENIPFIFREFRQLSEGSTRTYEGLGLGLTLAMKMAKLIGARIEVESEEEMGSTFTLVLNPNQF
jgi:signal transduction histidine kinase